MLWIHRNYPRHCGQTKKISKKIQNFGSDILKNGLHILNLRIKINQHKKFGEFSFKFFFDFRFQKTTWNFEMIFWNRSHNFVRRLRIPLWTKNYSAIFKNKYFDFFQNFIKFWKFKIWLHNMIPHKLKPLNPKFRKFSFNLVPGSKICFNCQPSSLSAVNYRVNEERFSNLTHHVAIAVSSL